METKFSLIIPTYNRANLISQTLQSVCQQTYQNFETIIVDDGSTDHTEEVVKKFLSEQIKYFKIPNGERAKARNFGVQQAKGEFITFLDSDDLLLPNFFEEANNFIVTNPDAVFFSLGYQVISPEGKILYQVNKRKGNLARKLTTGNHLSCIAVFAKKIVFCENPFNENRELSGTEDYELWLRIASRYTLHYNNVVVASIVNHGSRSVLDINEEKLVRRMQVLFDCVEGEDSCMKFYRKEGIGAIKAHSWLYVALHLAMARKRKAAFKYLLKAILESWKVIFTKKSLVIVKKLFLF